MTTLGLHGGQTLLPRESTPSAQIQIECVPVSAKTHGVLSSTLDKGQCLWLETHAPTPWGGLITGNKTSTLPKFHRDHRGAS